MFLLFVFFFKFLSWDPDKAIELPLLGRGGQPWGYLSCSMCCCRSPDPPLPRGTYCGWILQGHRPIAHVWARPTSPLFLGLYWPLGLPFLLFQLKFGVGFPQFVIFWFGFGLFSSFVRKAKKKEIWCPFSFFFRKQTRIVMKYYFPNKM